MNTNIPSELDNHDWAEVFGEGCGYNCTTINPQPQPPGSSVSTSEFHRIDVERIIKLVEGENDGASWVVYGQLKDGRFFVARGGCDYTGWDCRADNSGDVALTQDAIERFGLSQEERERLGVTIKDLATIKE
jgi:hypothetical protein